MSKELRFRAWDADNKDMFHFRFDDVSAGQCGENDSYLSNCVVMQYTGLLDKNGKEIYEGDIVRVDSERYNDLSTRVQFTGEVIMSQGGWRLLYNHRFLNLCDHYSHSTSLEEHDCCFDDGEVIGNIHENTELLK